MAEKNEFLFDLKTPETSWKGGIAHSYFPDGTISSDVGTVTDAEGPHGLYWFLDSLMYKTPEGTDATRPPNPHFHWEAGVQPPFLSDPEVQGPITQLSTLDSQPSRALGS